MDRRLFAICVIVLGLLSGHSFGADAAAKFEKDVVYGKAGDVELKMDLARPATGEGPFPCVVCIHGGGWRAGNKSSYDSTVQKLAAEGYVAATIGYRFCPEHKFPAQVEDVKCAVRYLRAHAKELKINPDKFGAMGASAGGHLALMLGLMNKEDGCEGTGGCQDQSSKVQCVVNFYGPADFTAEGEYTPVAYGLVNDFLGTVDRKSEVAKKASPMTYIDKNDPPVLTFHGSADPLVPVENSKQLHAALKKAGVEEKLEILEGKSHGWGGADSAKTAKEAVEFLDQHLKK